MLRPQSLTDFIQLSVHFLSFVAELTWACYTVCPIYFLISAEMICVVFLWISLYSVPCAVSMNPDSVPWLKKGRVTCILCLWFLPVFCTYGFHLYFVPVVFTCILYLWFSPVFCTCGFHLYFVPVVFTCILYLWFSPVFCTCGFHLYFCMVVPLFCICGFTCVSRKVTNEVN